MKKLENVKIGNITYNQQPHTLTPKQIYMAQQIAENITSMGIDVIIEYDNCTIDIIVVMDSDPKMKGLSTGRFRVFWAANEDNKIQYLKVGIGHYDGYEIKRGWSNNIEIKDVVNVLATDMAYYSRKKNQPLK